MMQPLETSGIDVALRPEWAFVQGLLRALINDRTLITGKRRAILFAFEKILTNLRADFFQDETDVCRERIVAEYRMPRLDQVDGADNRQDAEQEQRNPNIERGELKDVFKKKNCRNHQYDRVRDEARLQRQWPFAHRTLPNDPVSLPRG